MQTTNTLDVITIIIGLLGGLAIFLFGMEQMTDALKNLAGARMKSLLAKMTTNRFKGVFAGAFVTAIIQSSSVTTVLVVGFITAGLMSLSQAIGIIMGANIGTTITAQIIAFDVTRYALLLVAVGFGLLFTSQRVKWRRYGSLIMGLGLIFFGMELMSAATEPLRAFQPFINLMHSIDNPLVAIIVSAIFTGVIQSSSATTGIIIVLASRGFITLEAGIALALGANLGTCITALMSAIGKPPEAAQAALVHVIFNVFGIVIWLGFINQLADFARWVSPTNPQLQGMARITAEAPRQIANAHTLFNLANTLIFIWFVKPLAQLARFLVPERLALRPERVQPQYLNKIFLETPELAFQSVKLELDRLGRYALRMVRRALPVVVTGSQEDLATLAKMDEAVDTLHGAIITYLGQLSQRGLLRRETEQIRDYITITNYIENICDLIETNLVEVGYSRLSQDVRISQATQEVLTSLYEQVGWTVEQALKAVAESDKVLAQEVIAAKPEINRLAEAANDHLGRRLIAEEPDRLETFRIETEIIEYLKRMYYFAKRIAKIMVETNVIYSRTVMTTGKPSVAPAAGQ